MGACLSGCAGDSLEGRYAKEADLYSRCLWTEQIVSKMVEKRMIAPKINGCEERSGTTPEECPICMMYFPSLNRLQCCSQSLCTVCLVQIRAHTLSKNCCPFCMIQGLRVKYYGPLSVEELRKMSTERQRTTEALERAKANEVARGFGEDDAPATPPSEPERRVPEESLNEEDVELITVVEPEPVEEEPNEEVERVGSSPRRNADSAAIVVNRHSIDSARNVRTANSREVLSDNELDTPSHSSSPPHAAGSGSTASCMGSSSSLPADGNSDSFYARMIDAKFLDMLYEEFMVTVALKRSLHDNCVLRLPQLTMSAAAQQAMATRGNQKLPLCIPSRKTVVSGADRLTPSEEPVEPNVATPH